MKKNKQAQERKEKYQALLITHPHQADGMKRFIYTDEQEKDNHGIIPKVIACRMDLKHLANHSNTLFDEELEDLQCMLKSQLGKKVFNKLCKVFAK